MSILAEASNSVQIINLIIGSVTTLALAWIGYMTAQLKVNSDKTKEVSEKVLEKVNGQTKAQLEINSRTAQLLVISDPNQTNKESARAADEALAAHIRTDDAIKEQRLKEKKPS